MIKLLNHACPNEKNFKEFKMLMEDCRRLLDIQTYGSEIVQEIVELLKELINYQDSDGYWRVIYSDDIPFDCIVEYWKYPTILFTAIMMNLQLKHPDISKEISGFDKALMKSLERLEKAKLSGSGYGSFGFKLNALKTLLKADLMKFIELYPDMSRQFNEMILNYKSDLEKNLKEGETRHDYNEEFSLLMEEVLYMMNGKKTVYLFVYGTLMRNNRKGHTYLNDAQFKGNCIMGGYSLYDLGYFPGIVADIDGKVKGELYAIAEDKLPEIDIYEAEGSLYKRKIAKVYCDNDESVESFVYVYNQSVSGKEKVEFLNQPWVEGKINMQKDYVWYACYGSNINKDRFMKYIIGDKTSIRKICHNGCTDKTHPIDEKPIIIKHPIYFSNHSGKWNDKGVAFLDINKKDKSYGKMYLITKEQFEQIQQQESNSAPWYSEKVNLGFENEIPILTFTQSSHYRQDVIPCDSYLDVIKKGISKTYPKLKDVDIDFYLMKSYLDLDRINVLKFIRQQEHGVSIQKITNYLNKGLNSIINIIHDLKNTGFIKQDGNSIRMGIEWNFYEATYYTISNKREVIDLLLIESSTEQYNII